MKKEILDQLLFIDTETTGLEEKDRVFQIAHDFREEEKESLFKPEVPISIEASETTGFVNGDVENKESFLNSQMKKDLENILESDAIFVAHNAKFDIKMLEREGLKIKKFIDTLKVAQFLDPQGRLGAYRLQYLRYALNLEVKNAQAHNALGDIRVLKALFLRLYKKMEESGLKDQEILEEMMKISKQPVLIKRFSFGKYVGKTIEEVIKIDRGYLEWLLREKQKQAAGGEIDEDWIYTLQKHL